MKDKEASAPGLSERAAFEDVIRSLTDPARHEEELVRDGRDDESYDRWPTAMAWEVWKQARAAQSGQRAGVAEGWQLVPKEPTWEMVSEGAHVTASNTVNGYGQHVLDDKGAKEVWRLMLAAAPTQQQEENK